MGVCLSGDRGRWWVSTFDETGLAKIFVVEAEWFTTTTFSFHFFTCLNISKIKSLSANIKYDINRKQKGGSIKPT